MDVKEALNYDVIEFTTNLNNDCEDGLVDIEYALCAIETVKVLQQEVFRLNVVCSDLINKNVW